MRVTVDGNEISIPTVIAQTLQELLNQEAVTPRGRRLVVDVVYNGRLLAGPALNEQLACPVADDDEIDLRTEDRFTLAHAALSEAAGQMDQLAADLPQVISDSATQRGPARAEMMTAALGKWQVIPQTIQGAAALAGFDPDTFTTDGRTVAGHLGVLVEKLGSVRDAFRDGDSVLVSDLLQYEMPGLCTQWAGILRESAASLTPPN